MSERKMTWSMVIGLVLLACIAGNVHAQGMAAANAAFDRQFNARLQAMQQQNANSQQQLWQNFLRTNGPRLQQEYARIVASGNRSMSFEQYAYWDLMTARGTNVQGALQHQQNQFAGRRGSRGVTRFMQQHQGKQPDDFRLWPEFGQQPAQANRFSG